MHPKGVETSTPLRRPYVRRLRLPFLQECLPSIGRWCPNRGSMPDFPSRAIAATPNGGGRRTRSFAPRFRGRALRMSQTSHCHYGRSAHGSVDQTIRCVVRINRLAGTQARDGQPKAYACPVPSAVKLCESRRIGFLASSLNLSSAECVFDRNAARDKTRKRDGGTCQITERRVRAEKK